MNFSLLKKWTAFFFLLTLWAHQSGIASEEASDDAYVQDSAIDWNALSYTISGVYIAGHDENRDTTVTEALFGVGLPLGKRVGLYGDVHLAYFNGERENVEINAEGIGITFQLRWHFLKYKSWGTYLDYGPGFIVTTEKFPPGGTTYNFITQYGMGLDLTIRENVHLLLGFREQHLSNGKGIGEDNPTYDGAGMYAQLLVYSSDSQDDTKQDSFSHALSDYSTFNASVQGYYGLVDDEHYRASELQIGLSASDRFAFQAGAIVGNLVGETLTEFGFYTFHRMSRSVQSIYYGYKKYADFKSNVFSMGIDYYENEIVTVSFGSSYERDNFENEIWLAGLFLNLYLSDNFFLRSGLATDQLLEDEFKADDVGLRFGLEWKCFQLGELAFSLYAEQWITEVNVVGFRVSLTDKMTIIEQQRNGFLARIR
ncbi:acyloxyacyl hydrolase [candidate division CSSED10-310 bacterium]|uniref:Acyloxyacyl hydrolase n=1 Tax=candidate division CSSED10-310 bacterium TaxID=2855610 RepID=A0ABV6YYK3_UNCC1